MYSFPRVNSAQLSHQRKTRINCVGDMLDMRGVHVQRIGETWDHEDIAGVRKIIKTRRVLTRVKEAERQRGSTEKPHIPTGWSPLFQPPKLAHGHPIA